MPATMETIPFTWGGCELSLEVDTSQTVSIPPSWSRFLGGEGRDLVIRLEELSGGEGPKPGWHAEFALQPDGSRRARGPGCEIWIDAEGRKAKVLQPSRGLALDAAAKAMLAHFLLSRGGLLLHGVGLAYGSGGVVFSGESGAGKSTLGQLAEAGGIARLSDELVSVLPEDAGGYVVRGTPWNVGQPGSASLKLVGVLVKDTRHFLESARPADVVRTLLPNIAMLDEGEEGRAKVFQNVVRLLKAVPCAKLHFARDMGVAAAIREAFV